MKIRRASFFYPFGRAALPRRPDVASPVKQPADGVGGAATPPYRIHEYNARGFTLVEIAIALGVIGFALVAIIGILPAGLQIQRDNRAETIINQDGTFWLEAIRNGARGLDELMDHVESIEIRDTVTDTVINSYANNVDFTTGSNIIGLLTTPAWRPNTEVRAVVTAISGAAAEKSASVADRELAFRYQMTVQIERPDNYNAPSFTALSTNAILDLPLDQLGSLHERSLYELRLNMAYAWVRDTQPGTRRQTYRTSITRSVTNLAPYYFFVP